MIPVCTRPPAQQRGSLSIETVVAIPLVVLLLLFVIGAARLVHARTLTDQAADQAAGTAAFATGTAAQARAQGSARAVLAGSDCTDPSIALTQNQAARSVTATVSCTIALRDLLTAGFPGHETLTSSETAPRNLYAGN